MAPVDNTGMHRSRVIQLALLAVLTATASAAAQDIDVQLLFDGRPLRSTWSRRSRTRRST